MSAVHPLVRELTPTGRRWLPRVAWPGLVALLLLVTFALDRAAGSAPLQHLYYLPIILAAVKLGRWGGPVVALGAVVLYHITNPVLLTISYGESDIVQIALFLTVGFVAARLVDDTRRLGRLAITDDLTGLYNLRGFEERLIPIVSAARRKKTPVSLLVLDVDRLKSLNDTHGHRAGADAVRIVGHVLATHLDGDAIPCRFGGDEFVVALPGYAPARGHDAADRLRRAVHALAPTLAGMAFPPGTLSISIGLAHLPDTGDLSSVDDAAAGEALFRAADRALYVAKAGGRNRIGVESTAVTGETPEGNLPR
jgi:diguanylate cyclase (GGDEF)-like protein